VDGVRALLPELQAQLPKDIRLAVASDRTTSIRSALHEVELTLVIAIILVVLVVSAFLRSARATFIPAIATVVSLLGTFGVMYLLGFSLNNLSLFGLVLAIGIVVDDAIVVVENVERKLSEGIPPKEAAYQTMDEVGTALISTTAGGLDAGRILFPMLPLGMGGRFMGRAVRTLDRGHRIVDLARGWVMESRTTFLLDGTMPGGFPGGARAADGTPAAAPVRVVVEQRLRTL